MKKVLISLSGGMDSATALGMAVDEGHKVYAIGFFYASKHAEYELKAAKDVASFYAVPYEVLSLAPIMSRFNSALIDPEVAVPEGHYQKETMRQTVVPGRNTIMTSILAGIAESEAIDEVWLGIHSGDHFIYPDCRPEWFLAMQDTIESSSDGKVYLKAPLLREDKASILQIGYGLKTASPVPYHLTRTCYKAQKIACGRCGSCQERLEAFAKINREDPIEYETRDLIAKGNS